MDEGRSRAPMVWPFLRRLVWTAACNQFVIKADYVPGRLNTIADTRFLFQKFRTLAPEADPEPTPVPPYSETIFL